MLLKPGRDVRRVLIAVPLIPDGRVYVEGPAGIIVKGMSVPVPAVAHVEIQNGLGMVQHHILFDGIALHMQKGHIQHVEKPPVLRHGAGMGEAAEESGDQILFLFGVGGPDLIPADPQADDQRAGFHRLLIGPEGLIAVHCLKLPIGSRRNRISRRAGPKHLALVILPHGIPADGQLRIVMDQRGGDEKASGKPFKHLRFFFRFQRVRGRVFVRIGDLRFLSRKHHRILKAGDIFKDPFQQILPRLDPAFPHQPGIGAFFKIQCLRLKCHNFLSFQGKSPIFPPSTDGIDSGNWPQGQFPSGYVYQIKTSCPVSFQMASIK